MTTRKRLVDLGVGAGAVAVALGLFAGPQASASTGTVSLNNDIGMAFSGVPHQDSVTTCQILWQGPVTSNDGNGNVAANIDSSSTSCDQGVSVTSNTQPWALNFHSGIFTIDGIDVNITTSQGTCRYTGSVKGIATDQTNLYMVSGTLSQQSTGCGGDAQIGIGDIGSVFSISAG
jgi:hypothetical protein